jgi:tellurite resistance protein TerC
MRANTFAVKTMNGTVIHGRKVFTPILVVFIALGLTDLVFAIDSIPAIFGITDERDAVVEVLELVDQVAEQEVQLAKTHEGEHVRGEDDILAFIGVKLFFHALHVNELPFINGGEHVEWAPENSSSGPGMLRSLTSSASGRRLSTRIFTRLAMTATAMAARITASDVHVEIPRA